MATSKKSTTRKPPDKARTLNFRAATVSEMIGDCKCKHCEMTLKLLGLKLDGKHHDAHNPLEEINIKFTPDFYAGGAFNGWHIEITKPK